MATYQPAATHRRMVAAVPASAAIEGRTDAEERSQIAAVPFTAETKQEMIPGMSPIRPLDSRGCIGPP
jgi:hypothetical protein